MVDVISRNCSVGISAGDPGPASVSMSCIAVSLPNNGHNRDDCKLGSNQLPRAVDSLPLIIVQFVGIVD